MEWLEQREAFYKIAIARGMTSEKEIPDAFPLGSSLPPGKMEKWLARFMQPPSGFSTQRRYINRFRIGADPEFTFLFPSKPVRRNAMDLGLKQGPAFGADNNGRLAEIRPYPSRSALEVCASILATLRWMAIISPRTLEFEWHAGAWSIEDGLGGHVHFGRKRPNRAQEIKALDVISESMLDIGIFDQDQQARRRAGDSHHQLYGRPGDFRLQAHGYEYRTFPSWLDSPSLAFITMTLAKLAVHDPNILWKFTPGTENIKRLCNLLRFYKSADDDARLALAFLERGVTLERGDFKGRWGIHPLGMNGVRSPIPTIVPLSIKPTSEDVEEMFNHLCKGTPLTMRMPTPTWGPVVPLPDYRMVIDNCQTIQRKGLGELCWDLCYYCNFPITLWRESTPGMNHKRPICISKHLSKLLPANDFLVHGADESAIYLYPPALDQSAGLKQRLLAGGLLPIWRVQDVKADSYNQWRTNIRQSPRDRKWKGSWLRHDGKMPGIE